MDEHLDAINIPGIDLEPLDPFLEDVFAGMDDHPPGLWHPTLLEAPVMGLQNTAVDDFAVQSPRSQHAAYVASASPTAHKVQNQGATVDEQFTHSMSGSQQEGRPSSHHQQLQSNIGSGSEPSNSAFLLPRILPITQALSSSIEEPITAPSALGDAGELLVDMHNSSSSSTLSPVAPADELAASSTSAQLQYGSSLLANSNAQRGTSSTLDSCAAANGAARLDRLEGGDQRSSSPVAAAPGARDGAAVHRSSSSGSSASRQQSLAEWVPDIDEVPSEPSFAGTADSAIAVDGFAIQTDAGTARQQQHQDGDQGSMHSCGGPQHSLLQAQEAQQGCSVSTSSAAAGSTTYHPGGDYQSQYGSLSSSHQQQGGIRELQPEPAPLGQQQRHGTDCILESMHGTMYTPTACCINNAAVEPPPAVHTAAAPAVTPIQDTSPAEHDITAGSDDSGEFVSPSVSWHSCSHTTAASSHMTSHSVMSAASFATVKGLPTLSVGVRAGASAACSSNSQGYTAGVPTADGGTATSDSASSCVDAQSPYGAAAADDPTAVSDEFACFLDPLGALEHQSHQHQQRHHNHQQDEETNMVPGQQHGFDHPGSLHQQQSSLQQNHHQQHMNDAGLCDSSSEAQHEQQQRWQQELWQDVSPPSLGSSPPTPGGYTTVHPIHMEELPAAETQPARGAEAAAAAAAAGGGSTSGLRAAGDAGGPEQHTAGLRTGQYGFQGHIANSSYMLRQSELVDLSLSMSVHPSQQQQQFRPGWLTAHQHLPPAAAQAVERAVSELNDSYFFHERSGQGSNHPSQHLQHRQQQQGLAPTHGPRGTSHSGAAPAAAGGPQQPASGSSPIGGPASSGLLGPALIRRSAGGHPWSHASTQPQQDQQARHILPSNVSHQTGWASSGVLGQWFNSTVQQPLTAVASRTAAGVGKRLAAAGIAGPSYNTHSLKGESAAATGTAAVTGDALPRSSDGSAATVDAAMQDAVIIEHTPDLPQSLQEQEDTAFQGLLFLGGRDSHGRPVVIVNTDAIPAGHNPAPRDAALAYLLKKLTPIVSKGHYVLIMVAFHHGPQFRLLPGVWCVRAYHALPRAFRKNVKHVVLLQPSLMVRAGLALLYPFVSSKAHAKIKQVHRLLDIEAATSGEVQVPHLGEAFLTTVQQFSKAQQQAAAEHGPDGTSRTVPVPGSLGH